jgi:glycosyltransferase involved in cell wall biosynthesis
MISVALLESIACGLLVVTTKVGGVNDIIVNGYNGFCVESRNPAEMAEKIMSCLEMDKTLACRNVLAVAEQFFPEKVIPLLIQALLD